MLSLEGNRIAVTGALGGLGLGTCVFLRSLGAEVIAIDRVDSEEAISRIKRSHLEIPYIKADVSRDADLENLEVELSNLGFPNALVSLAGIVNYGRLHKQSSKEISEVIDVNATAQAKLAKVFLGNWVENKVPGKIVLISSWASHVPWPEITPYSASKAAVVALARGIAREYAIDGIRSNVVSPGIVYAGMAGKYWDESEEYRRSSRYAIPLGRLQKVEEVAQGIAFLLSSWAEYITGTVLEIDGGASLYPMSPSELGETR